ncbi:hypothetical protein NUSPORA_00924 [Nucleospora cyclopteri]
MLWDTLCSIPRDSTNDFSDLSQCTIFTSFISKKFFNSSSIFLLSVSVASLEMCVIESQL